MRSQKPLLIYDGDCGFCRSSVARIKKRVGDQLSFAPYQEVADQFPQIPQAEFTKAVQLVSPDGKVQSGAEAIFSALALNSFFFKIIVWKYTYIPGFKAVSEWVYGIVARNRSTICSLHTHR